MKKKTKNKNLFWKLLYELLWLKICERMFEMNILNN